MDGKAYREHESKRRFRWIVPFGFRVSFCQGLCRSGGEEAAVRGDADAWEIEPVGIEADAEGGIDLRWAAVVDLAGGYEEVHAGIVELEVAGFAEIDGELGTAGAVFGVGVFVFAAGIMEDGEKADDLLVGRVVGGEVEAVAADGQPMAGAVDGVPAEAELGGDKSPEGEYVGKEVGKHGESGRWVVVTGSGKGSSISVGGLGELGWLLREFEDWEVEWRPPQRPESDDCITGGGSKSGAGSKFSENTQKRCPEGRDGGRRDEQCIKIELRFDRELPRSPENQGGVSDSEPFSDYDTISTDKFAPR